MTFFLVSAFLILLLSLHETHNYVSLSQRLSALLGPEPVEIRRPRHGMTPTPVSDDARNDNALIAGSRRSKWPRKKPQKLNKIASCFMCNDLLPNYGYKGGPLLHIKGIPYETLCDDAWNSFNHTLARMRAQLRVRCYQDPSFIHPLVITKEKMGSKKPKRADRGVREMYGNFVGGCFKRFLDVGKVYTARGCRYYLPWPTSGFAAQRFQALEFLLVKEDVKDGCISSPYASLTPFSRGVSLYVYYHVCVCSGNYCNTAPATAVCWKLLLLILSIYLVI